MHENIGKNFPVAEYYRQNIIDAKTIKRSGRWWSAVLLIEDPRDKKPFIGLYMWELRNSEWKVRKKYLFRRIEEVNLVIQTIQMFSDKLEQ